VTGGEVVGGRKTYVLTHTHVNKDASKFLVADAAKKYQGKLQRVDLTRAWVDVSRGCLPLKMEWESYYTLEEGGRPYSTRSGAYQVLEVRSLQQVEKGGFYPTRGSLKRHAQVAQPGTGDGPDFDDFLRGKTPKVAWVPAEEDGWDAYLVRADLNVGPALFELEYPKNTVYYDQLAQKGMSTSGTQERMDEALQQVAPGNTTIPGAGPRPRLPLLLALNGAAFAAVVGLYLALRRRRAARRAQS
jgi:hypothetical protein